MAAPTSHRPCAHAETESGRSPNPLFIERRKILGRLQSESISLHVTPEEKKAMVERMKEAVSPSMRAFILDMCMNGKIIVNSDLRELNQELHYNKEMLDGHNDHRIVMAMSVILSKTGGAIRGVQAVKKSYPDFFENIRQLGADVTLL